MESEKKKYSFDYSLIDKIGQNDLSKLNQIISQIISEAKKCKDPTSDPKTIEMLKDNSKIIKRYYDLKHPKAILLAYMGNKILSPLQQFPQVSNLDFLIQNYKRLPLLSMCIGKQKFSLGHKDWQKYFKDAIQHGQIMAYILYGALMRSTGKLSLSFQIFKNVEHLGWNDCANLNISFLYYLGAKDFPKNLCKAYNLLKSCKDNGVQFNEQSSLIYESCQKFMDEQKQLADAIKNTQLTEAIVVGSFFKTKFQQYEIRKQQKDKKASYFRGSMSMNTFTKLQCGIVQIPRTFYVVCSPYLIFPSRGFLVEDEQNKSIQIINIYGWQVIPKEKLKLLHKLGTKVILHQYIYKLSRATNTPMYRVQNPYKVEIIQNKVKHNISDQKLRKIGSVLFKEGRFDLCIQLYKFMQGRNCDQMEVIFSNMGLCYQKLGQFEKQIQYYQKSLKVKRFLKSQYRLAKCYLNKKQIAKARKIIDQMDESPQKAQLIQLLKQIEQDDKSAKNLELAKILQKNKKQLNTPELFLILNFVQRQKLSIEYMIGMQNPEGKLTVQQLKPGLQMHRNAIQGIVNQKFNSQLEYISKMLYYLDTPEAPQNQMKESSFLTRLQKFYTLAYKIKLHIDCMRTFIDLKMNFLQKRLQECSLQLYSIGQFQKAIQLLLASYKYSPILAIHLIQMLRQNKQYNQGLQIGRQVLEKESQTQKQKEYQKKQAQESQKLRIELGRSKQRQQEMMQFSTLFESFQGQKKHIKSYYFYFSYFYSLVVLQIVKTLKQRLKHQKTNKSRQKPIKYNYQKCLQYLENIQFLQSQQKQYKQFRMPSVNPRYKTTFIKQSTKITQLHNISKHIKQQRNWRTQVVVRQIKLQIALILFLNPQLKKPITQSLSNVSISYIHEIMKQQERQDIQSQVYFHSGIRYVQQVIKRHQSQRQQQRQRQKQQIQFQKSEINRQKQVFSIFDRLQDKMNSEKNTKRIKKWKVYKKYLLKVKIQYLINLSVMPKHRLNIFKRYKKVGHQKMLHAQKQAQYKIQNSIVEYDKMMIKKIVSVCQEIVNFNEDNLLYVTDRIAAYITKIKSQDHHQQFLQFLLEQLKNSKDLQSVWVQVDRKIQRRKNYFNRKLRQNQARQQIQQILQTSEKSKDESLQLQALLLNLDEKQDEFQRSRDMKQEKEVLDMKLEQIRQDDLESQLKYNFDQVQGYANHFRRQKNETIQELYLVTISTKMEIEKQKRQQFILAANKICSMVDEAKQGIKVNPKKHTLRLKNRSGEQLTGNLQIFKQQNIRLQHQKSEGQKQKSSVIYLCKFDKLEQPQEQPQQIGSKQVLKIIKECNHLFQQVRNLKIILSLNTIGIKDNCYCQDVVKFPKHLNTDVQMINISHFTKFNYIMSIETDLS